MIVPFDENVQERDCTVLFELNGVLFELNEKLYLY